MMVMMFLIVTIVMMREWFICNDQQSYCLQQKKSFRMSQKDTGKLRYFIINEFSMYNLYEIFDIIVELKKKNQKLIPAPIAFV